MNNTKECFGWRAAVWVYLLTSALGLQSYWPRPDGLWNCFPGHLAPTCKQLLVCLVLFFHLENRTGFVAFASAASAVLYFNLSFSSHTSLSLKTFLHFCGYQLLLSVASVHLSQKVKLPEHRQFLLHLLLLPALLPEELPQYMSKSLWASSLTIKLR